MPILLMNDGQRITVSYEQAVKIKQVLDCTNEPEDEAQEQFVAKVKEVIFEGVAQEGEVIVTLQGLERPPHDTVADAIIADNNLSGYEKFKAMGKRLKERPKYK